MPSSLLIPCSSDLNPAFPQQTPPEPPSSPERWERTRPAGPSEADWDTRWSLLDILESHARSTALRRYPASADVRPRCPRFLRKNSTGIGWISPDRPSAPKSHRHALAKPDRRPR